MVETRLQLDSVAVSLLPLCMR